MDLKVIFVGDGGCGKSSIVKRLNNQALDLGYNPTVGVEMYLYLANEMMYNIWDTAGQEKFSGLGDGYYINGNSAVIVVDATSPSKTINSWYSSLKKVNQNIKIGILVNKIDCICAKQQFINRAKIFSQKNNIPYLETDTKNFNLHSFNQFLKKLT